MNLKQLVRKKSRSLKQKKYEEIALNCKTNQKKFWQFIRSKSSCVQSGIGDIKFKDGISLKICTSDLEKAKLFSDYFSSIFTIEDDAPFEELKSLLPVNSMSSFIFSESEVLDKLNKLKIDKSPGS